MEVLVTESVHCTVLALILHTQLTMCSIRLEGDLALSYDITEGGPATATGVFVLRLKEWVVTDYTCVNTFFFHTKVLATERPVWIK